MGDLGSVPGLGRSPGEGNGNPLQYSCLENSMDRGAWWAIVHGVVKSRTRLSHFTFTFHFHALEKEMATHSSSCLENPRDGGAWWAAVYGVTQSWTRLMRLSSSSFTNTLFKHNFLKDTFHRRPCIKKRKISVHISSRCHSHADSSVFMFYE